MGGLGQARRPNPPGAPRSVPRFGIDMEIFRLPIPNAISPP